MITLLENINIAATLLLLLITLIYYRILRKKRRNQLLSPFEKTMYILATVASLLFVFSSFALYFGI